ncbi:hypothetical protein [Stenotrophomonas sp. YIM B06876]|uniref:hypothetical protein n=1 Tax=Stenotrophomonas sp. YIM B06876 TaxID=3060211 RepID=UPI002739963E|nr:hypothetical protein [Stenotrophomonas sp. YIM B06876]
MAKQLPGLRVSDELHAQAINAAKERGMTPAAYQREALRAYLKQGEQKDDIEHLEARFVATLGRLSKDIRIARNDVHVCIAFIDTFARSYLLHTPPIPPEAVQASAAAADVRYDRFLREVAKGLHGDTGLFERMAQVIGDDHGDGDGEDGEGA